jgi:hypothetical protein
VARLGGGISFARNDIPVTRFVRIWLPNGFERTVNAASIKGKDAQFLGVGYYLTKWPGLRPGHDDFDAYLEL